MALGLVLVVVCVMLCAANPMAQTGALVGLLVGVLSGPLRVAAVDFRQWLRDPGEPAEASGRLALRSRPRRVRFSLVRRGRIPVVCLARSSNALRAVGVVAARLRSGFRVECRGFARLGRACNARPLGYRRVLFRLRRNCAADHEEFVLGVGSGAAVVHLLVELVWHLGLVIQPDPAQRRRVLAAEPTPVVLPVINRNAARRRLIVCCDGTWNWPDGKRETNVIRLVRAIAPVDGTIAQMVYYHQGVGTGNILDRIVGGGAGVGLSLSVKACYGFVTDNYVAGDGDSPVRLLARRLHRPQRRWPHRYRRRVAQIGDGAVRRGVLGRWYSQPREARNPDDLAALAPLRHTDVEIECIGVWDTVGALGIPGTRFCTQAFAFYETELGTKVRHAFQALAIDERRANFQAAVWVPFSTQRYAHRAAAHPAPAGATRNRSSATRRGGRPASPQTGVVSRRALKYRWRLRAARPVRHHVLVDAGAASRPWLAGPQSAPGGSPACPRHRLCDGRARSGRTIPDWHFQNPRTIGWRLDRLSGAARSAGAGCSAERIYASAWDRVTNATYPVPRNDAYLRRGRRRWLEAMRAANPSRREGREPFEERNAVAARGPALPPPRRVPNNIGFCGKLLQFVGGSG